MANQSFQRASSKGKLAYSGMCIAQQGDVLPPGKAQLLINVVTDEPRGAIRPRPGLLRMGAVSSSNNPVHSIIRFIDSVYNTADWFYGAGAYLYWQQSSSASPTQLDSGFSGAPLSLIPYRPPNSSNPRLYAYDSAKQAKYDYTGAVSNVGVSPPAAAPATALAKPVVLPIADITTVTGWSNAGAAGAPAIVSRVAAGTTVGSILYDTGTTGWCCVHPSTTSFAYVPTLRPVVLLNGWGNNSHVGPYEMGTNQATGWGLNNDTTYPYVNPGNVTDGNTTTYADFTHQHTHKYSGCIWSFNNWSGGPITGMSLNVLSQIPASGTNGVTVDNRSAGVWYSVDGGQTWTMVYNAGTMSASVSTPFTGRASQWDSVSLPANTDPAQVQVMAFADSHDNMAHYIYEVNLASSGHNAAYSFGARVQIGSELVTLHQTFAAMTQTTVAGIIYDNAVGNSGTGLFTSGSGMATLQATAPIKLNRNQLIVVNGNNTRVQNITQGPDGLYSFRCSLPSGVAVGHTIVIPTSFRCYTTSTHAAAETITSNLLSSNFAPTTSTATGLLSRAVTLDLTQTGGRPISDEDYLHVSLRFDHPENVQEVHVLFDADTQTNDFTGNYYYYTIQSNQFQGVSTASTTTRSALLNSITDQVSSEFSENASNTPNPSTLPLGLSQFFEATFRLSDLTRVGTDPMASLANIFAVGLRAIVNGAVTLQFNSFWLQGTYGPDANWNSSGNQGQEIIYRYRYRSSKTGVFSNPSPATRSGDLPMRGGVNLTLVASSDTQIDLIDVERNGGTFDSWHQCITVANTSATILDNIRETVAMAGDALPTDVFPPWPITDVSHTLGTSTYKCSIVGTRIYCFDSTSFNQFNTKWARGTSIIVNNKTYTLYASPSSVKTAETNESIGVFSNVAITVPEATILGQPLPYAVLWDGRVFATGDSYNPGVLYFSKSGNPDGASDADWIEVTGPHEPLLSPIVFEGALYVFSNQSLYRVDSTQGGANPYASSRLGSIPSGLISPWAVAAGPALAWEGNDGIYLYSGTGGAANITDEDLAPLFRPDSNATQGGYATLPMVSTSFSGIFASQNRISWSDNKLYFNYFGAGESSGDAYTLVYDLTTKGWIQHQYEMNGSASGLTGATLHYLEPKDTKSSQTANDFGLTSTSLQRYTILGGVDGVLYIMSPSSMVDADGPFHCRVVTPLDDQGETRARKQYGDVMLDYSNVNLLEGGGGSSGSGGDGGASGGVVNTGGVVSSSISSTVPVYTGSPHFSLVGITSDSTQTVNQQYSYTSSLINSSLINGAGGFTVYYLHCCIQLGSSGNGVNGTGSVDVWVQIGAIKYKFTLLANVPAVGGGGGYQSVITSYRLPTPMLLPVGSTWACWTANSSIISSVEVELCDVSTPQNMP